jgi:methionyl-tRNA synthetase
MRHERYFLLMFCHPQFSQLAQNVKILFSAYTDTHTHTYSLSSRAFCKSRHDKTLITETLEQFQLQLKLAVCGVC